VVDLVKKLLLFWIILLLVGVSIPSTGRVLEQSSTLSSDGNYLYVGGDGPGNYTKIQYAINNASDGDTVFVYNGAYLENVVVNKSINLIGEDKNSTIIDGNRSGHVVYIKTNWVNISGFTIRNGDNYNFAGVGIYITSKYNIIKGNKIAYNNHDGINIKNSSSNNTITQNIIISNNIVGIYIDSNNNTIRNNTVLNNEYGISFVGSNNTIIRNIINSNRKDGIIIHKSNSNNIVSNNISNNYDGIVFFGLNYYNNIKGNNIILNNRDGINIWLSTNNIITQNNIILNNDDGIEFFESSGNNITWNNFISNNDWGIYIDFSNNNTISRNNFLNNKKQAFFKDCKVNMWIQNYWNKPRILPKLIFGLRNLGNWTEPMRIPWLNIDWRPALKPYDI
jgi:parallel beta-helix repeat protein